MDIGGFHWRQVKVSQAQTIFSAVLVGERIGLVDYWGKETSILFRSKPLINGRPVSTTDHDQSEY